MTQPPGSAFPLLRWRPRYFLPTRLAALGLDPMALRTCASWLLSLSLLAAWVVACVVFQDRLFQPGREDKLMSFFVFGGTLVLTIGVLMPSVLLDMPRLHRWLVVSGPVPLPERDSRALDTFLRQTPKAVPVLLEWLVQQRVDTPHCSHAQKLSSVDWEGLPLLESPVPNGGLAEVVALASTRRRADSLELALVAPPSPEQPQGRPRL